MHFAFSQDCGLCYQYDQAGTYHIVRFYIVLVVLLVPWILYSAITLPQRHAVHNWDTAWVGSDIILLVPVIATVILAFRRSRWVVIVSAFAGGVFSSSILRR